MPFGEEIWREFGDTDTYFNTIAEMVCTLLKVPVCLITVVLPDKQVFRSQKGLPEPWDSLGESPLSHSFCQHVVAIDRKLVINDALQHPLVRDNKAIIDFDVIAYLGMPIHDRNSETIGSVCAIDKVVRNWTDKDEQVLGMISWLVDHGFEAPDEPLI